jgi:DNA-binding response OmpR family regulator
MTRSPTKYIAIVALSGRDDEADKVHAVDLGPNDYVTGPFRMEDLLARVRAALRRETKIIYGEHSIFGGEPSADSDRRIVKCATRR